MPRIRKKTSNRQNTRDRAKITKKVAEHKKKSKRGVSRGDGEWKSKKKADIGVPNSFHMKDQVLAEMAEEKRLAAEARLNKKKGVVETEDDAPGVSSVSGSSVSARPISGVSKIPVIESAAADDDAPELLDSDLPTLQAALDAADVLLEVVDARDIAGSRNVVVETLVSEAGGKVFIVINKADLVPREALAAWVKALPFPAFVFSAREGGLGRDELLGALAAAAKGKRKGDEPLKAALLGGPNVGKTSVLNALLARAQFKTAPAVPTALSAKNPMPTTTACVEVSVTLPKGGSVSVIDTPGWEFVPEDEGSEDEDEDGEESGDEAEEKDDEDEDMEGSDDEEDDEGSDDEDELEAKWDELEARVAGDLLRRNLGRVDKVKDVFPLASWVFARSNPQDLMLHYNVPYFTPGDLEAFLTGLARVNQRVKKFGEPNHDAAARIVLFDWAHGKFPYYSMPPKDDEGMAVEGQDVAGRVDMSAVLEQCKSRKELKAASGRGLVRFVSDDAEVREIFLDDDYTAVMPEEDSDEEDEEDEGDELDLEDGPEPSSGSDVEESDEEESEPEPAPTRAGKRKAAPASPVAAAKKPKVAKSVVFNAKLEAPRTAPRDVKEKDVRPILKAPKKVAAVVAEPKKAAVVAEVKPKAKKAVAVAVAVAAPKAKKPVNTPIPKVKASAPTTEKKTQADRLALRAAKKEAKTAAKAEAAEAAAKAAAAALAAGTSKKRKAAGAAPVAAAPVKGKKAKVNGAAAVPVAAGETAYDFSKHF